MFTPAQILLRESILLRILTPTLTLTLINTNAAAATFELNSGVLSLELPVLLLLSRLLPRVGYELTT